MTAQSNALRLRKYVQSHLLDHPANESMRAARGMLPPVDGTEVWFGSLAEFERGAATDEGRAAGAAMVEDERRCVDFGRSRLFLTREHTIFDNTR